MVLPNRVGVSPLCQYTGVNDIPTEYHKIHYGAFALRGAGLVMVEATTIIPHAGVSTVDVGLYNDKQEAKLKEIVDFAHANTSWIGIQLGHTGRKDWDPRGDEDKIVAPSALPFREGGQYPVPRALTVEEIHEIVKKFSESARRAVSAGFDFVEIHGAHGYLINEFMSAHSNKRTDQYGGSYENRIRFLLEFIDCVRANMPEGFPVLSDSNPDAWILEDSVRLAPIVVKHGVDVLDVSGGGNDANTDRLPKHFGMFMNVSEAVKKAVGDKAIVPGVGRLHDPVKVNELHEKGTIDFAFVGAPFMVNQGLVFDWAETLDVKLHHAPLLLPVRPEYAEMI
ncbi:NADH:flavin oxidoreductase/12-oxophytodienoate reductase [Metschnikowia bicuspidata var. bicuspidata NRRL YB-4993]|uniref:NADH:flavin oxidoreductase/12-oxophytodienoate reductase n=1 Tax=Metschnikowia bicuspidata var. bicuspidata NRRL YB-4993 TaxID=869754 RepID=A0A1A0H930_9ASCO|nr:NADH:flavin oxidoreductase/12-oxophytodienoate reductase [Metschnikowia bicuspidata var. bicuspidata NRRL YB-4993]OBA20387.1 NADH:flavin oxidoreductase/12-oxophytodienoate reductase [Metschnikowia bicuspidata var. bicuspidata NRRL YB-4993]